MGGGGGGCVCLFIITIIIRGGGNNILRFGKPARVEVPPPHRPAPNKKTFPPPCSGRCSLGVLQPIMLCPLAGVLRLRGKPALHPLLFFSCLSRSLCGAFSPRKRARPALIYSFIEKADATSRLSTQSWLVIPLVRRAEGGGTQGGGRLGGRGDPARGRHCFGGGVFLSLIALCATGRRWQGAGSPSRPTGGR